MQDQGSDNALASLMKVVKVCFHIQALKVTFKEVTTKGETLGSVWWLSTLNETTNIFNVAISDTLLWGQKLILFERSSLSTERFNIRI